MKQDIRDLFREEDDFKTLPKHHRAEFLDKLKRQPKEKTTSTNWLKIAAVAVLALTVGFSIFYKSPEKTEVAPIVAQIEAVEAEYLKDIEAEWESFVAIADDSSLVSRFRTKLNDLDQDYQTIAKEFKAQPNTILVIEDLISNLQTRLKLLKDIQAHIKILNQKTEQHENTI